MNRRIILNYNTIIATACQGINRKMIYKRELNNLFGYPSVKISLYFSSEWAVERSNSMGNIKSSHRVCHWLLLAVLKGRQALVRHLLGEAMLGETLYWGTNYVFEAKCRVFNVRLPQRGWAEDDDKRRKDLFFFLWLFLILSAVQIAVWVPICSSCRM